MAGGHYVTIDEEMEVLRDKVIEAAKAWHKQNKGHAAGPVNIALVDAVEALLAVEGA